MRASCSRIAIAVALAGGVLAGAGRAHAGGPAELSGLDAAYPRLDALYKDLHRNPELSQHEDRTAGKLAAQLRALGFEVTEHVGGHGVVGVHPDQAATSLYNDPALIDRLGTALRGALGADSVVASEPIMPSEDFGSFGRAAGVPSALIWVGAAGPAAFARAKAAGTTVAGVHSAGFTPDREPTIRTGIATLTLSVLELLGKRN